MKQQTIDFKKKWNHFCQTYDRQDYDEVMELKKTLADEGNIKED